ncbi:O-antigen ligase family protein [Aurantiacibacter zhengii]|uniref:O-antigen ligase family protein n=1 Tax=Aurantiacibacter zhengii TaxID=2307003 RepID=UPI0013140D11|nr:O-antigen ligase family protein [Aurantiacibacter zhengii]
MRNLLVQLFALALLAWHADRIPRFTRTASKALIALVVLSIIFPVLQSLPLPLGIWQALPGRALAVESFAIAGVNADHWFSVSVSPVRTMVAFAATLVPAAVIIIGCTLPAEQRITLAWTVPAAAVAALLLGTVQLSTGNTVALLYDEAFRQGIVLSATFANRNSTAIFFVIALCLLASLPQPRNWAFLFGVIAAASLLIVGTFLTQSRTGMVLLFIPVGLMVLRGAGALFGHLPKQGRKSVGLWIGLGLAAVVGMAIVISALSGGRIETSIARFSDTQTDRPEMWEDGLYAASQYWPAGSGMGTTDDVFQIHESLEYVSPRRAVRVHNDYIEIAIEGGMASLALAALWLGWIAWATMAPGVTKARWPRLGAGAGIAAIVLQSLLDYPLRNLTILCVAAVLVVLLAGGRRARR